jgi:hypothetical protein
MKLGLTEKQYNNLLTLISETELEEQSEPPAAAPEKGTSSKQAGGQGYPEVGKWESGVTRGPGNQVGVTKWADVVGAKLTRSKANQLKEQKTPIGKFNFNPPNVRAGSEYFASVDSENRRRWNILSDKTPISKYIYKEDDGDNLFMNLMKGQIEEALLDLRSVTFTPGGMATQTVIEVIFSETVVVPIAIESLNAAVLLNDIHLYIEQGEEDSEALLRIFEDLMVYAFRFGFKFAGKKLKAWAQSPEGKKKIQHITTNLSSYITSIQKNIQKIPSSKLKNYVIGKLPNLNLLKNIINKISNISSNVTSKVASKMPIKLKKAIVAGLFAYISAEGLDRLLHKKVGTTREEMAKPEGPSDEYMADVMALESGIKPNISKEDIKTAEDLNILIEKGDLKNYAIKAINLYKNAYPCLTDFYKKNQFVVIASTKDKDIFKINNEIYFDEGGQILNAKTNIELAC